ncbi:GntR family transcriptional regulator [Acetobacteraceae bacterium H6797]|nr:GntR family transcriptional regulator [Acetobacteraceae bacterium H6797]
MASPAPTPAPSVQPLDAGDSLSLAERAYRHLREAIVKGQIQPGGHISERSLANALGISAQPVREALRRLESDGMVISLPRRGTVVAEFTEDRLSEMGHVRAALEGAASAIAAARASESDISGMLFQLRAMREATDAGDIEALARANEQFHALLHNSTGNVFLIRSLAALRAYDYVARRRALAGTPREPSRAFREHCGILAAIRRRDASLAERRTRSHVLRSMRVGGIVAAD